MVEVDADADRREGVTFVSVRVENTHSTPQTVCIESQLDGPTWPPGLGGPTDPAWSGDRWEATIEPGRRRGFGFASPAPPSDDLVEVVSNTRANGDRTDASEVIAGLEDFSPPSQALNE